MYFVGLDLAWGERNPTGVAVVDDNGALVQVSAQTDDASILAAIRPYVADDCVVGIDAPLIVTNPKGNRPCEAALNKDFAKFQAGAHPSNTGKPEFANGTRGGRLAAARTSTSTRSRHGRVARWRSIRTPPRWRCSGSAGR